MSKLTTNMATTLPTIYRASTERPAIAGSAAERHGLAHTIPGAVHPGSRPRGPGARFGGWIGATVDRGARISRGGS